MTSTSSALRSNIARTGALDSCVALVNHWAGRAVVVLLLAETVMVFAAVLARYVVNYSLPWADEVARALLTWLVFVGGALALARRELVALTYFRDKLPDAMLRWLQLAMLIAIAFFIAVLGWTSLQLMNLTSQQTTPVLQVPLAYVYAAIPLGCAMMLLNLVREFVRVATGQQPLREGLQP